MQDLYNLAFERAVLSSIFFDASKLNDIDCELDKSDFGYKPHSLIFATMQQLNAAEMPINEEFVRQKLVQDSQSKQFNIDDEIGEILAVSPITSIKSYVSEIKNLSLKRKLRHLALVISEKSGDINASSDEILDTIEKSIFELSYGGRESHDFRVFDEVTKSVLGNLSEIKARQSGSNLLIGIDTGFSHLNRLTAGFKSGELIILAARPAMGKTALALNMAIPTLSSGKSVAFFSLEMDAEQIAIRLLSSISRIPLQNLRIGDLSDKEWQYFSNKTSETADWKLYIDDSSGLDIAHLRSKLRRQKLKDPDISLAIVDYLQLMGSSNNRLERHLQVAEISRGLKLLARELNIPILALSQLNRALESRDDRRPQLSDLRESGSIEQDADIILFIYRDDIYQLKDQKARIAKAKKDGTAPPKEPILEQKEIEEAELIIGKHRNGPIGTIHLKLHTKFTRFTDADRSDEHIEQTQTKMLDSDIEIASV